LGSVQLRPLPCYNGLQKDRTNFVCFSLHFFFYCMENIIKTFCSSIFLIYRIVLSMIILFSFLYTKNAYDDLLSLKLQDYCGYQVSPSLLFLKLDVFRITLQDWIGNALSIQTNKNISFIGGIRSKNFSILSVRLYGIQSSQWILNLS
jgi:hypothetical protein